MPNGTKYNYKIDERDRWETLPIKGKRVNSWIDRWVYSTGDAFIIWNIDTIKKCKYVDTVPDKIFHIGLPKAWGEKTKKFSLDIFYPIGNANVSIKIIINFIIIPYYLS